MIQFSLKCDQDHRFDSWFKSSDAFEKLKGANMIACAVCGSADVEKTLMAPRVRPARSAAEPAPEKPETPSLSQPATPAEQALADLRKHVEANSDYVGTNFASEARAMYLGDSPTRAIHGEAKPEDAKALIDDGVPVAPLPFRPSNKSN